MASLILGCPWSLLTGHWAWSHPCWVSHCLWALSCPRQVRHCYGHCLAHAGLLGIVKDRKVSRMTSGIPMAISYYCQFFAAGITHRAVVATGCWHCYCWLFIALFFLDVHGIIIVGVSWHYYYLGSGNRGVAFCNTTPICALQRYI